MQGSIFIDGIWQILKDSQVKEKKGGNDKNGSRVNHVKLIIIIREGHKKYARRFYVHSFNPPQMNQLASSPLCSQKLFWQKL